MPEAAGPGYGRNRAGAAHRIVVLIAIFDLGQVFFVRQLFTEQVRHAARWGVVHSYDATALKNMVLYNQPSVPEGRTSGFCGLTADMVTVTQSAAGTSDERITVAVSGYPYRLFTPGIAGVFNGKPVSATFTSEAP